MNWWADMKVQARERAAEQAEREATNARRQKLAAGMNALIPAALTALRANEYAGGQMLECLNSSRLGPTVQKRAAWHLVDFEIPLGSVNAPQAAWLTSAGQIVVAKGGETVAHHTLGEDLESWIGRRLRGEDARDRRLWCHQWSLRSP